MIKNTSTTLHYPRLLLSSRRQEKHSVMSVLKSSLKHRVLVVNRGLPIVGSEVGSSNNFHTPCYYFDILNHFEFRINCKPEGCVYPKRHIENDIRTTEIKY